MEFTDSRYGFRFEVPEDWSVSRGLFDPLANLLMGRRVKLVHRDGSYIWIRVFNPREPVDYNIVRKTHVLYFDNNRHLLRSDDRDVTYNGIEFKQITYRNYNTGVDCCSIHFTNGTFIFAIELAAVSYQSLQAALPVLDAIMSTWRFE